jgi:signal transduction histidine kinase
MSTSNLLLGTYPTDALSSRERFWKAAKRISFFTPFVATLLLYPLVWKNLNFNGSAFMFSLSVSFIALILAGIYFFSYRFFGENFYYFISVSWLTNAIYLIPELNGPSIGEPGYPSFRIAVTGLSLLSTGFLVVALLTRAPKEEAKPTWKEIPYQSYVVISVIAIVYVIIAYLVLHYGYDHSLKRTAAKLVLPTSAASFFLLWTAGIALMLRLRLSSPKWIGGTLLGSYFIYATLQFTYPFKDYMTTHLPLFLIAQVAKVVNAIAMTGALQSAMVHQAAMQDAQIRSEVKIKEAELEAQEERLRSREQFIKLGMLASAIKHDVVTPIATMGFDLKALQQQFQNDHRSTRRLESLNESKDRIEAIVKIVDIFRGDKAFFDRDQFMTKASMIEIAHRAVRSVKNERPELKQDKPAIRITITGKDVWVRAYVPMLEQVLVNVIKNGIEAIEEAKRESGRIKVNVAPTDKKGTPYSRWVKVEIEDNGCGIPEENIPKLTTLFTTRADKKPNSGIGLFIGKSILEIHNGEFDFKSTVGEGTVVTLLLPEFNALQKVEQGITNDRIHNSEKPAREPSPEIDYSIENTQDPLKQVSNSTAKEQIGDKVGVTPTAKSGGQQ